MAAFLEISADLPKETVSDFMRACDRYRTEVGNTQAVSIRRGVIALVKGLRARTAKAKKIAPLKDVTRYDGPGPHWITPKGKGQKSQRRWSIQRHGGNRAKTYVHPADSRGEARRKYAQYKRWGLAKHSWGWFMHALFNRAELTGGNPRTKIDSRMVKGQLREIVTGPNKRIECLIVNKLDYIRDALPESALAGAMSAATRYIDGQIDKGLAKAKENFQ